MKFVLTGKYLEIADVRGGVPHNGIDIAMPENSVLRSITDGYVAKILHNNSIGNGLVIKDQEGNSYIYGHLNKIEVQGPGERIAKGQEIALSGNTGNSTGPHLHFAEKDPSGHFVDPTHLGSDVVAMSGGSHNWLLDKYNHFADHVIEKENYILLQPFLGMLKELCREIWIWFLANLPDIMGYGTILAGVVIIIGSMIGRGGMLKSLAIYAGGLILSICILLGTK